MGALSGAPSAVLPHRPLQAEVGEIASPFRELGFPERVSGLCIGAFGFSEEIHTDTGS